MRRTGCVLTFVLWAASAWAQDGAALYAQHCGMCHDLGIPRTPTRQVLSVMEPERIVAALETGTMRVQGAQRTAEERRAIAAFLTGKAVGDTPAPSPPKMCSSKPFTSRPQWNGWGVTLANDRFQRDEIAKLKSTDVPRLKVKWAFGFGGDSVAAVQPSIVGGRVFVASVPDVSIRWISRKDACTGHSRLMRWCGRQSLSAMSAAWRRRSSATWRHGLQYRSSHRPVAMAAAGRRKSDRQGHRHAGLYEGRLYVTVSSIEEFLAADPRYPCCTFRGSVLALDAATGEVAWKRYVIPDPPKPTRTSKAGTQLSGPSGAAIWSSPTLDPKTSSLYVATGDNYSEPATATSERSSRSMSRPGQSSGRSR